MIGFRIICAVMVAWAINWALARPEAAALLAETEEMRIVGPIAGAIAGYLVLPKRAAVGILISTLNGLWAGVVAIGLSAFLYLAVRLSDPLTHGLIADFEAFLRILGYESGPLIEFGFDPRLIGITVGAVAVTGFVAALVRFALIWLRRHRGEEEPKKQAKSAVARAGGPLS